MTTVSWKQPASADWSNAANWQGGVLPGSTDTASIAAQSGTSSSNAYMVQLSTSAAVAAATLADTDATLSVSGSLTVSGALNLTYGTLAIGGIVSAGTLTGLNDSIAALGGTLSGATLAGTLNFIAQSQSRLSLSGVGFGGSQNVVIEDGCAFTLLSATTTIAAASISFYGGYGSGFYGTSSQTLNIGAASRLTDVNGAALSAGDIVNAGQILAGVSGDRFNIETNNFNNSGNIAVSNGETLYIGANPTGQIAGLIDSTGTISATGPGTLLRLQASAGSSLGNLNVSSNATLEISGNINLGNSGIDQFALPGTLSASNAIIALGGVIANQGTIVTGAYNGNYVTGIGYESGVTGAEITGGTVIDSVGLLDVTALDNVSYRGILNFTGNFAPAASLTGTTTLTDVNGTGAGAIDLGGIAAAISLDGGSLFPHGGVIDITSQHDIVSLTGSLFSNATLAANQASYVTVNGGTIAHDITIAATSAIIDNGSLNGFTLSNAAIGGQGGGNLINDGSITGNADNDRFSILAAGNLINNGTIGFSNGETVTIAPSGTLTNNGTISVTGSGSVLNLDPGSWGTGAPVDVSNGATLILFGGSTTATYANSGTNTLSLGNHIANTGGTLALGGIVTNTGTLMAGPNLIGDGQTIIGGTVIDSSGHFALGGTLTNVAYHGTVLLDGYSSTLQLSGNDSFRALNGSGAGHIELTGSFDTLLITTGSKISMPKTGLIALTGSGAALDLDTANAAKSSSATLAGIKMILGSTLSQPAASFEINTNETLVLGASTTVSETTANANAAFYFYSGTKCAIVNQGNIGISGANAQLAMRAYRIGVSSYGSFTNSGSIALSNGASLMVSTVNFTNTTAGAMAANGSTTVLNFSNAVNFSNFANGTLTGGNYTLANGARLLLPGSVNITALAASLTLSGTGGADTSVGGSVLLENSLANITATGTLSLAASHGFAAANALADSGHIVLATGALSGAALSIAAGGFLSGAGQATNNITDNGTILAQGGALTLAGAITGTGQMQIGASAKLVIDGNAGNAIGVAFTGSAGQLVLGSPGNFLGNISGFAVGDKIDLRATGVDTTIISNGTTLQVFETNGATLDIGLAASGVNVAVTSDGAGGSFISLADIAPALAASATTLNHNGPAADYAALPERAPYEAAGPSLAALPHGPILF
jgi:hypothetical protein